MKLLFLLPYLFSYFLPYFTFDIDESLQYVLDSYEPDFECVFNYTEVNSKTIKFFPKCDTVYGIIVINENADLTSAQLQKTFKKMTSLVGGIRIENSKLEDLSFFALNKELDAFSVYCETYGVFIMNNPNLTDVGILWNMYLFEDDDGNECEFRIENNPKLDAEELCDYGTMTWYMDLRVSGNLKDCGCLGHEISESSLHGLHNCTKLFGGLHYVNKTVLSNFNSLSNIQIIKGGIDIQNSDGLRNLSFLENLQTIQVNNALTWNKTFLNLQNNPKLDRLAIPYLNELSNVMQNSLQFANINGNSANFCLTIEELCFFLENQVSFLNLETKICNDNRSRIHDIEICHFRTMRTLPEGCNLIIGDLIVNSGDEEVMNRLQGNIIDSGNRMAIFQDNHEDLFEIAGGVCDIFGEEYSEGQNFRKRLDYAGGDCGERVDVVYQVPQTLAAVERFSIVHVFSLVVACFFWDSYQ